MTQSTTKSRHDHLASVSSQSTIWHMLGITALSAAILVTTMSLVRAQAVDGVVVDLSVLGDGGVGSASSNALGGGKLQLPSRGNVRSKLHIAPKSRPSAAAKPVMRKPAATKPTMAINADKAPMVAPKPVAAAAPPQPITKPKPKAKVSAAPPPPAPKAPASQAGDSMAKKAPPAPPPVPKPVAEPTPPAAPSAETASAPANITLKPGRALRIPFGGDETSLPAAAQADLNVLANTARDAKDYRLVLMAYAGAKDLSTSKARRISLSRALAVRSFLIDKGVRSTQIDVRALGNKTSESPANRVDVNLAKR